MSSNDKVPPASRIHARISTRDPQRIEHCPHDGTNWSAVRAHPQYEQSELVPLQIGSAASGLVMEKGHTRQS
ncbi:hypothetical protein PJM28_29090, partial [Mycobacterium kansasii]